jgi:hypothetical protein
MRLRAAQANADALRSSGSVKLKFLSRARVRRCLALALCTTVALIAAVANVRGLRFLPPGLGAGSLQIAGASTQATLDLPGRSILQSADITQFTSLTLRTVLIGEIATAPPELAQIAHLAGVDPRSLSGATSYLQNVPEQMLGPDLEVRANQIIASRTPFHLNIQPDPNIPRLEIYARAPTPAAAERLANAVVPAISGYLRADAVASRIDPRAQLRIQQIGPARGGVINGHAPIEIGALTFLIVFGLTGTTLWLVARLRRFGLGRLAGRLSDTPAPAGLVVARRGAERRPEPRMTALSLLGSGAYGGGVSLPMPGWPSISVRRPTIAGPARATSAQRDSTDAWPHTQRILPWLIALLLFVLWLVPFDSIQIGASLPIDLKFDRIVLPIIALVWAAALAAGGRAAPRLRLTWVHVAVFGLIGFAGLSLVLGAHSINQALEFDRGLKRLTLLFAYVMSFVMIASVVRRSEVSAFLRYTLVLAVVAAIGTLIEYRFQYNIFYDLAHKLLPGFQVGTPQSSSVDNIGRRLVEGPAEVPLEAVGMFTMALPIALVGITDSPRWKQRYLYGLAAALLLAASISTERKSGLLGPLAVIVTLAFFRRQQLLRLAPLAVVLLLAVKVLAPGAIGAVTTQLAPGQLNVTTVNDRVIRYDAIRPDIWDHLAFGQGYGTYDVRVLDNQLLVLLIEGGVLGLAAYVMMFLTIVFVAIRPITRRKPVAGTVGLAAASAALGALVLSALFDWMGFPHGPYILLSLAALLVVAIRPDEAEDIVRSPASPEQAWR